MRGFVKFFDRKKGFGKISGPSEAEDAYFHISYLHEPLDIPLCESEEVEFELRHETDRGPSAHSIRRIEPRYRGVVDYYADTHGKIRRHDTNERVFAHYTNIVGIGFKTLEEGEEVEFSLASTDRGLQAVRIFRVDTRTKLMRFADMGDYDAAIERLSRLAPEDWNYRHSQSRKSHPVLRSYLRYTFERIQVEGKIAEAPGRGDQQLGCFNTGLATPRQEQIFAVFSRRAADVGRDPPWHFEDFCRESDRLLTYFGTKPDLANYFSDPRDLLYDTDTKLEPDVDHIIVDNKGRFPIELQGNEFLLRSALDAAIESAKRRVRRNYKAAIPNYYKGRLQLLLPLCMLSPERADLALVVARENRVYRASTVLTLDMAYNNARLIARPDREWLDP